MISNVVRFGFDGSTRLKCGNNSSLFGAISVFEEDEWYWFWEDEDEEEDGE
jgi:hypothetical protein